MRLSFYRSVTVTQFKLCFDVQRSKHSFVADCSDTNLIDDATIQTVPCPLNAIDTSLAIVNEFEPLLFTVGLCNL